jgi:restriction system protein
MGVISAEAIAGLDKLSEKYQRLGASTAEAILMDVLGPLLEARGYSLKKFYVQAKPIHGVQIVARRGASDQYAGETIGIHFRYREEHRTVGTTYIGDFARLPSLWGDVNRLILLINTRFTMNARELARRLLPVEVELMDADALRAWVRQLDAAHLDAAAEVRRLVRKLSHDLALLIARDPTALEAIEWRALEEIIAETFSGIGFQVTLTPGSKDGGKDVILECRVSGRQASYIVEVKHWRSGGRVGSGVVRDFLNVIAREHRDGGLFLSTSGYCENAFEQLSQLDRQRLRFGEKEKILTVCRKYERAMAGIWSPPENLADLLYEETI